MTAEITDLALLERLRAETTDAFNECHMRLIESLVSRIKVMEAAAQKVIKNASEGRFGAIEEGEPWDSDNAEAGFWIEYDDFDELKETLLAADLNQKFNTQPD